MSGHLYGEPEPKQKCSFCGALCIADFVDIGVGMQQCGPYHCERCGASEWHPDDDLSRLTEYEKKKGWYGPGKPPSPKANTDDQGNIVRHFEADTLYRKKHEVPARYDEHGRFIK